MITETYTFKIWRFDPAEDEEPYYQEYTLGVPEGMTVLEALLCIQAEQDGTLTFRYSCRGAVCGSCAMVINGHVDLACRTQMPHLAQPVLRRCYKSRHHRAFAQSAGVQGPGGGYGSLPGEGPHSSTLASAGQT